MKEALKFKNPYKVQLVRDGHILAERVGQNMVTTQGKNHVLDVVFNAATAIPDDEWIMKLINNSPTPTLAVSDTVSSHSGWDEFTGYTGGAGIAWEPDDAASSEIVNPTSLDFAITSGATIYGFYVQSEDDSVLFSTVAFDTPITVISGDTLKITYTIGLA